MRITFLTHFPGRGGSTMLLTQLAGFFRTCGHEVSVVVGDDDPEPMFGGYRVVPRTPRESWRTRMANYVTTVEETKPELIYTISGTDEFNVLRFLRCRRALHVSSLENFEYADMLFRLRQLEPFNEARTANTPDVLDQIAPMGNFQFERLLAPYHVAKAFLATSNVHESHQVGRRSWIDVCFVGRLENVQKRLHWFPEIMRACHESGLHLRWHIYGSGPAEAELRNVLEDNGHSELVRFHGWLEADELAARLREHDLFFLCSRWEGLPIAMVETMLCGQACVVPAVPGGMKYMLSNGGGWLYEAKSPQSCVAALLAATEDKKLLQQKREEAQRIARELFAPEAVQRELVKLESALCRLQFNGRVLSINRARKFRSVPVRTAARRRILQLGETLWKRWRAR